MTNRKGEHIDRIITPVSASLCYRSRRFIFSCRSTVLKLDLSTKNTQTRSAMAIFASQFFSHILVYPLPCCGRQFRRAQHAFND